MVVARASQARRRRRRRLIAPIPILASFVALHLPPSSQQAMANAVRATVLLPFIEMRVTLTQMQIRVRDFEVVQGQIDSAMAIVASHRTLAEENRQLRGLLGLGERDWTQYVPASVVRSALAGSASVFRFGAGANRGVRPFTAVVSDGGLFGQILEVHSGYAVGIDWSHPDFRVGAMTPDANQHGLIEVERGEYREQDRLVMRGVPFLPELASGTRIVTSGRGGVFPRGIPIGEVVELAEARAGWSRSYYLNAWVQPGAVTHGAAAVVGDAWPAGAVPAAAAGDADASEGETSGSADGGPPPPDSAGSAGP